LGANIASPRKSISMDWFDYRYVYLMRKYGSSKYKIGIARNPELRRATVDKGIKGDVQLVMARKVILAGKVERYLHEYFAGKRFFFAQASKVSGRTEWFHLNFLERLFAKALIELFGLIPVVIMVGSFLLFWFWPTEWNVQ